MKANPTGVTTSEQRAKTIKMIDDFRMSFSDLEGFGTHRFLFQFAFKIASEIGYNRGGRLKLDLHYYLIRELMQLVYSCDKKNADFADKFLEDVDFLIGDSIGDLLSYQEEVLRAYFTSDMFDSEFNDILLFDQEIQRLLQTLKPLLNIHKENASAA